MGTHGRLKLWSSKRQLNLDTVVILVFDEADEMLKADGFADDSLRLIRRIRQKNPGVSDCQMGVAVFNSRHARAIATLRVLASDAVSGD